MDDRTDEDMQFIHVLVEQCHKALVVEQVQGARQLGSDLMKYTNRAECGGAVGCKQDQ